MKSYLQRNSLLIVFILLAFHKGRAGDTADCLSPKIPVFEQIRYRASIDILNKHLSGLLFFKTMEDSSVRVVFVNEAGVTFFALAFSKQDYTYLNIHPSMDKRAVKRTLAKDIGMILMRGIYRWPFQLAKSGSSFELKLKRKGKVRYHFKEDCPQYVAIENFGRKKNVVSITQTFQDRNSMADSIFVRHHTVNFTISLKKLHATE